MMENGFEVCPKCNGKGVMRYKAWDSRQILLSLAALKRGLPRGTGLVWVISIECPRCDGAGKIDWVRKAVIGSVLPTPFKALDGNIDIYYFRALKSWPRKSSTHRYRAAGIKYSSRHIGKILTLSQARHTGIKLNPTVLTLSADELLDLCKSIVEYHCHLTSLPNQEVTEEVIKAELTRRGLGDFMPDKFAIPGPDDYPPSEDLVPIGKVWP
jgi:hypothetical protein